MCKSNWLRHVSKAVLIAAALLLSRESDAATAQGAALGQSTTRLAVGWNFIRINVCIAVLDVNGNDLIIIYPTTGGQIVTFDPVAIIPAAQFCANGNAFWVLSPDGVNVTQIALIPGLK